MYGHFLKTFHCHQSALCNPALEVEESQLILNFCASAPQGAQLYFSPCVPGPQRLWTTEFSQAAVCALSR